MNRIEMSVYRSVGKGADRATTANVIDLHNVVELLVEAHNAQFDQPEPTGYEHYSNADLIATYRIAEQHTKTHIMSRVELLRRLDNRKGETSV